MRRSSVKPSTDDLKTGLLFARYGGHFMGQFIEGKDRHEAMLLPECLCDHVGEDRAVRAIGAFVEMLDLAGLGFSAAPTAAGDGAAGPMVCQQFAKALP